MCGSVPKTIFYFENREQDGLTMRMTFKLKLYFNVSGSNSLNFQLKILFSNNWHS